MEFHRQEKDFICVGVKRGFGKAFIFPDANYYNPAKYSKLMAEK